MRLGKILIIDGSFLLHRALHVGELYELCTSDGIGTGGVFQFLRSMYSEVKNFDCYYPIVCWDAGLAERRLSVYDNYKHDAERKIEERELKALGQEPEIDDYLVKYREQRELTMAILKDLGVPSLRFYGWEGDDLLYIVSRMTDDGVVLTDDKDLIQLLSPTIRISRPMAGQLLEYNSYQAEHHDPDMRKFITEKAIVGDVSDNIPKCAEGVGPKTASYIAGLMIEHRDDWKDILSQSTKKAHRNFLSESSLKQFEINMELIDLNRVKVTSDIVQKISMVIENETHIPDYFKTVAKVGQLEMTDLDINGLIAKLTDLYRKGGIFNE